MGCRKKIICPSCGSPYAEHVKRCHLSLEDFVVGSPTYGTGKVKGPDWGISCEDCGFTPDKELENC